MKRGSRYDWSMRRELKLPISLLVLVAGCSAPSSPPNPLRASATLDAKVLSSAWSSPSHVYAPTGADGRRELVLAITNDESQPLDVSFRGGCTFPPDLSVDPGDTAKVFILCTAGTWELQIVVKEQLGTRSSTFFAIVAAPSRADIDAGPVDCRLGIRFEGLDSYDVPRGVSFRPSWPDGGVTTARIYLQPFLNRPDFSSLCEVTAQSSNGLFAVTKAAPVVGQLDSFDLSLGPLVQFGLRATTTLTVRGPANEVVVPVSGRTFERCPLLSDTLCRGSIDLLTDGLTVTAGDAGIVRMLIRDDDSAFRTLNGSASVTDVALDALGRSWVTTRDSVCLVSPSTGVVRACVPLNVPTPVLAAGGADGGLLIVGGDGLYLIDPVLGRREDVLVAAQQYGAIEDVALDGDALWFVSAELTGDVVHRFSMSTRLEVQRFPLSFRGTKGLRIESGQPVLFTDTGFRVQVAADGGVSSSRLMGDWVGAAGP